MWVAGQFVRIQSKERTVRSTDPEMREHPSGRTRSDVTARRCPSRRTRYPGQHPAAGLAVAASEGAERSSSGPAAELSEMRGSGLSVIDDEDGDDGCASSAAAASAGASSAAGADASPAAAAAAAERAAATASGSAHTLTALSLPPVKSVAPSGERARQSTAPEVG